MKRISGRFRFLLACLLGLGLAVGSLFSASAVNAQSHSGAILSNASLLALAREGAAQCLQPPANVNLSTLSDAQLALYGLPTHAFMQQNPARWQYNLAHARHRVCGSSSSASAHQPVNGSASTQQAAVTAYKEPSPNWGGDGAYGARNTFHDAAVGFYVPTVQPSSYSQSSSLSIWAGLGGDKTRAGTQNELIQAGIIITIAAGDLSPKTESIYAFWENYGTSGNTETTQSLGSKPGDYIYAEVGSDYEQSANDFYFVEDGNTQNYLSPPPFTAYYSDSATGECIVEANDPVFADFGSETLYNCTIGYEQPPDVTINNLNHIYYVLTSSSGMVMETDGAINTSGTFLAVWKSGNK